MPARPLPAHARRSEQQSFSLTPGQAEVWRAAAAAVNLSTPDWIRRTCDAAAESEANSRRRAALEEARVARVAASP